MYLQKSDLAEEIRAFHAEGRASDRLGEMLMAIAEGVWLRFGARGHGHDRENSVGNACVRMLAVLPKVDPDDHPFGYLSQIAKNELWFQGRTERNYQHLLFKVARDTDVPEGGHGGTTKLSHYLDQFDRPVRVEVGGEAVAEVVSSELPDDEVEVDEPTSFEPDGFVIYPLPRSVGTRGLVEMPARRRPSDGCDGCDG